MSEFMVNGKHTMPVSAVNELKGHSGRTFLTVFDTTGGTKAAFTMESDKLHVATVGTDVHGPSKGRIATAYHLVNVIHNDLTGM